MPLRPASHNLTAGFRGPAKRPGSVKTTEAAPELKPKYRVEDGDMDAMVDAVNARLAGNDGVERAYRNDNQLIVVVRVGSEPEAIHAALAPGQVVDPIALDAGADATRSLSELLMTQPLR